MLSTYPSMNSMYFLMVILRKKSYKLERSLISHCVHLDPLAMVVQTVVFDLCSRIDGRKCECLFTLDQLGELNIWYKMVSVMSNNVQGPYLNMHWSKILSMSKSNWSYLETHHIFEPSKVSFGIITRDYVNHLKTKDYFRLCAWLLEVLLILCTIF